MIQMSRNSLVAKATLIHWCALLLASAVSHQICECLISNLLSTRLRLLRLTGASAASIGNWHDSLNSLHWQLTVDSPSDHLSICLPVFSSLSVADRRQRTSAATAQGGSARVQLLKYFLVEIREVCTAQRVNNDLKIHLQQGRKQ